MLNQFVVNPALTGIENYTDVKLSHRHQWVGLDGSPVTTYATIHTPIGKKDFRTTPVSYRVPGENPRGKSYWQEYTAAEPHHGLGLQMFNDRTGPLNQFAGYITYAYHLGLGAKTSLAAGFGAGVTNLSLNASKLNFVFTTVDPAVQNGGYLNVLKPDFNAGVYLYSADYFVGLSAQQIIPQKIEFENNTVRTRDGKLIPHIFLTAGYRLLAGEDFNFTPSVMVKYINPLPAQLDLNVKLQYLDVAWAGASYRTREGFAALVGINVSNTINVGYSYDYTTSKLNTISHGSHEIQVGFLIGNRYGDWCPKNVW